MSVRALAKESGVDRSRIAALEAGESVRGATIGALVAALDRIEEEVSGPYDADSEEPITSTIELPDGTKVTWQGPREGVAEEVERFLARRRGKA